MEKTYQGRCDESLSGANERRQIVFFQNQAVIALVAGDDKSKCKHANLFLAGCAAAVPGVIIERASQADRGFADGGEFLKKV